MRVDLPARYYRHVVDPGRPNTEAHLDHERRTLPLPAAETALVLVDCWDDHTIDGLVERMRPIVDDRIAPTLDAVRASPVAVVHCPSPDVAPAYPEHRYDPGIDSRENGDDDPDWPPASFRRREGDARAFAKHEDEHARRTRLDDWPPWSAIDPALEPIGDEPVVATGTELHRLLADRGITHLLYAGFHTNICIQHRDYGVRAMRDRGYDIVLLRDCTCAVESHDTLDGRWHERIAVRDVEVQVGWSATGEALRAAL